jgi:hypothetical protein
MKLEDPECDTMLFAQGYGPSQEGEGWTCSDGEVAVGMGK